MEDEIRPKKPIVSILDSMPIGGKEYFPAYQLGSVRTTASNMSFAGEKLFKTKTDRVNKIIIVTRIK